MIDLVSLVLTVYWSLVVDLEALKARQRALELAEKFFSDTQKQIKLGAMSRVDIFRAEVEVGIRKRELGDARQTVRQRENLLKNMLSRIGMEDPLLDNVEVVPLDSVKVPGQNEEVLPPLRQLVEVAKRNRPDVAASDIRSGNQEILALGTVNGLLPQLVGIAQVYNSGLSGVSQPYRGVAPNDYFVGGFGDALGQIFRRNFPNERAAVFAQVRVGNRIAQADYGIDQLELSRAGMQNRKDENAMIVDISNQIVALRQAEARYATAVATRVLQQELLGKTQRMFALGSATFNEVIQAQRNLVAAESTEIATLGSYARARIGLDQITGTTLEKNQVSLADALNQ
jgi:outer membrane protein TolC